MVSKFKAELQLPKGFSIGAPYSYRKENETHELIMVIMASGIAHGYVRTMVTATATTTELCNMEAILPIIGWQKHAALVYSFLSLILDIHVYWLIDTSQNRVPADQYHMTIVGWIWSLKLIVRFFRFLELTADQVLFFIWSRSQATLTCRNQGWVVWKVVSTNLGLKVNWLFKLKK